MTQKEVFDRFNLYFPQFSEAIEAWFPNGKNSIRIRRHNRVELIFTFNNDGDWILETVNRFVNRMKGEK